MIMNRPYMFFGALALAMAALLQSRAGTTFDLIDLEEELEFLCNPNMVRWSGTSTGDNEARKMTSARQRRRRRGLWI